MSWDDPATEDADLVILRATWDYAERRDEFLAWTRRVRNLLNAPDVVAWNSDKRYLRDLAAAGVPVVPSSSPSLSTSCEQDASTIRGWNTFGRASFPSGFIAASQQG